MRGPWAATQTRSDLEDRTSISPDELRDKADLVREHLLAIERVERTPVHRWWASANANAHYRVRHEIESPAQSKAVYMRRWGSPLAVGCAICFGYLWVMRASAATGSWFRALESPRGSLSLMAALVAGAAFGWWRISYEWNQRQRKLSAACEFADQLTTRAAVR